MNTTDTTTNKKAGDDLVQQMVAIAAALECKFTLKGESISADKVFAREGLLPAIMRRADQLSSFCLGYGLGVTFEKADSAILGVTIEFDSKTANSLRLLCATDALIEIMQHSPTADATPLDSLLLD